MIGVFLGWGVFLGFSFYHGDTVPLPVWAVPGATYALLSNRITGINIGGGGINMEQEGDEEDRKPKLHTKD